jgi:hypothetical protein
MLRCSALHPTHQSAKVPALAMSGTSFLSLAYEFEWNVPLASTWTHVKERQFRVRSDREELA